MVVVIVTEWASGIPWTAAAAVPHPGRHTTHTHAPVIAPALLPLLPSIAIVTLGTKTHAHPCHGWHPLHAEVRLVSGVRRNIRDLNMPRARAAVDDLVSNILRE